MAINLGHAPASGPGYSPPGGPGYNQPANLTSLAQGAGGAPASGWGGGSPTPPAQNHYPTTQGNGYWRTPTKRPMRALFGQPQAAPPAFGMKADQNMSQYPGLNDSRVGAKMSATGPTPTPDYGSQSGPTYVEDRYNQRANGTDPGWEYATGRATDQINRQYAARGGYNSSGAMNSIGDMFANATSQREGQLDTLSNEATAAHQNQLNGMFTEGLGIANGESAAGQAYGTASGTAQGANITSQQSMILAKAGIDAKKAQALVSAGVDIAKLAASIAGAAA